MTAESISPGLISNSATYGTVTTGFEKISSLLDAVDLMETAGLHECMTVREMNMNDFSTDEDSDGEKLTDLSFHSFDGSSPLPSGLAEVKKHTRKRINPESVKTLKDLFSSGVHFPSRDQREKLSMDLKLPVRTIQIWFQNRRQAFKSKRQQMSSRGSSKTGIIEDNNASILMTKLKYNKAEHKLEETRSMLRIPAYLQSKDQAVGHIKASKTRRVDIKELTRIDTILPRPPSISPLSAVMQNLPCDLPKIVVSSGEPGSQCQRLPSICHALRRFSSH